MQTESVGSWLTICADMQTSRTLPKHHRTLYDSGEMHISNCWSKYFGQAEHVTVSGWIPRVAATACTYFRRFYLKKNLCDFDPRLMGPACLFLACKTEECQVQAKVLYHFMRKLNATGALLQVLLSVAAGSALWWLQSVWIFPSVSSTATVCCDFAARYHAIPVPDIPQLLDLEMAILVTSLACPPGLCYSTFSA